jgi:hypothetical protein
MAEVDVLVVTALQEEFDAAREVASGGTAGDPGVASWAEHDEDPPPYHLGEYRLAGGGSLLVALARPVEKGGTASRRRDRRQLHLPLSGRQQGTAGFQPDHRQTPARESWIRAAQDLSLAGLSTHGPAGEDEVRLSGSWNA